MKRMEFPNIGKLPGRFCMASFPMKYQVRCIIGMKFLRQQMPPELQQWRTSCTAIQRKSSQYWPTILSTTIEIMELSAKVLVAFTVSAALLLQRDVMIPVPFPYASLLATVSLLLSVANFIQIGCIHEYLDELYQYSFWYQHQINNLLHYSFKFGEWQKVWEILDGYIPLLKHLKSAKETALDVV